MSFLCVMVETSVIFVCNGRNQCHFCVHCYNTVIVRNHFLICNDICKDRRVFVLSEFYQRRFPLVLSLSVMTFAKTDEFLC